MSITNSNNIMLCITVVIVIYYWADSWQVIFLLDTVFLQIWSLIKFSSVCVHLQITAAWKKSCFTSPAIIFFYYLMTSIRSWVHFCFSLWEAPVSVRTSSRPVQTAAGGRSLATGFYGPSIGIDCWSRNVQELRLYGRNSQDQGGRQAMRVWHGGKGQKRLLLEQLLTAKRENWPLLFLTDFRITGFFVHSLQQNRIAIGKYLPFHRQ